MGVLNWATIIAGTRQPLGQLIAAGVPVLTLPGNGFPLIETLPRLWRKHSPSPIGAETEETTARRIHTEKSFRSCIKLANASVGKLSKCINLFIYLFFFFHSVFENNF